MHWGPKTAWIASYVFGLAVGVVVSDVPFAGASAPDRLEEKLQHQFSLYRAAQDAVVARPTITREEYEKLLLPEPDLRLTPAELAQLRARQAEEIEASRQKAATESTLDLGRVRAAKETEKFCAELPKGGMLHVHPNGTANRETIHAILTTVNPTLSYAIFQPYAPASRLGFLTGAKKRAYTRFDPALQAQIDGLFVLPPGPQPFQMLSMQFGIQKIYESQGFDSDAKIYDDFVARAARERVSYVEFTRAEGANQGLGARLDRLAMGFFTKYGVTAKFNFAFNRNHPVPANAALARTVLGIPTSSAFVGVDLYSNETKAPAFETGKEIYAPILGAVRAGKSKLRRTMHAGELGDPRNARDAIILGAERIGHGVNLAQDPVTLEYARRLALPVETNLVSNLRLGVVRTIAEQPFLRYARLGLRPSLSTDDEGMLETDMNRECREAIDGTDIEYAELRAMLQNSIETSFASESEKIYLLKRLNGDLAEFEKNWRRD